MRILAAAMLLALSSTTANALVIGIVLLHGKDAPGQSMAPLGRALSSAGYAVEVPEMCWSKRRIYDLAYLDCMRDVDAAVERLKKRGAQRIVVLGQSLGGNFAIGYGANRKDLLGIIVTAGGHSPRGIAGRFPQIAKALADARKLIADGKGDGPRLKFPDYNDTGLFFVKATPKTYLSWYDPTGPANMYLNVSKLTAPLLWVSADADPLTRLAAPIVQAAPKHPLTRHVTIKATHRGAPMASRSVVVAWLKELAATHK
jgi:pimeloyl-ACP methyl ester carboxylesterase